MLGRLITGVGVGASSQIVPLYLSEVSPPGLRGTVNGVRRVAYVIGCLMAFQFAVPLQQAATPEAPPPVEVHTAEAATKGDKTGASGDGEKASAVESAASDIAVSDTAAAYSSMKAAAAGVKTAPEARVGASSPGLVPVAKGGGQGKNPEGSPQKVEGGNSSASTKTSASATSPSTSTAASAPENASTASAAANTIIATRDGEASKDESTPTSEAAAAKPKQTQAPPEVKKTPAPASVTTTPGATSEGAKVKPAEGEERLSADAAAEVSEKAAPDVKRSTTPMTEKAAPDVKRSTTPMAEKAAPDVENSTTPMAPLQATTTVATTTSKSAAKASDAEGNAAVAKKAKDAGVGSTASAPAVSTAATEASYKATGKAANPVSSVPPPEKTAEAASVSPIAADQSASSAKGTTSSSAAEMKAEAAAAAAQPATGEKVAVTTGEKLAEKSAARMVEKASSSGASGSAGKSASEKSAPPPPPSAPVPAAGWWRPLFYTAAAPAALLAASAMGGLAVESPVWLLGPEGCAVRSRRSLAKLQGIRGRAAVRWQENVSGGPVVVGMGALGTVKKSEAVSDQGDEDGESCESTEQEATIDSWGKLAERRNRQPVTIGLGLCVLAAFSGSNTVIYYASTVLKEAGLSSPGLLTYAVGIPNLLGGIIALAATDKYGRRPLLLLSFGGMAACLATLSLAAAVTAGQASASFCSVQLPEASTGLPCVTCSTIAAICDDLPPAINYAVDSQPLKFVALVTIPAYTLLFSLGAGPVPWLLYNEVFPTRIRARATAVCTAINYAANTVVGATFLPMVSGIGLKGTYAVYAVLCFAGYVFVDNLVFETKGLALQDIERLMADREKTREGERVDGGYDGVVGAGWWSEVGEKMEKLINDAASKGEKE